MKRKTESNYRIIRSYEIVDYPYADDDDCRSYDVNIWEICEHTLRIIMTSYMTEEQIFCLGTAGDQLWFIDTFSNRGLLLPRPSDDQELYSYFEGIYKYDKDMCLILSRMVYLLYHDILSDHFEKKNMVDTVDFIPLEPELPF